MGWIYSNEQEYMIKNLSYMNTTLIVEHVRQTWSRGLFVLPTVYIDPASLIIHVTHMQSSTSHIHGHSIPQDGIRAQNHRRSSNPSLIQFAFVLRRDRDTVARCCLRFLVARFLSAPAPDRPRRPFISLVRRSLIRAISQFNRVFPHPQTAAYSSV